MTRDDKIEQVLAVPISAESMAQHLVSLAIQGGGLDNIGLVVSQFQMNGTGMFAAACNQVGDFEAR